MAYNSETMYKLIIIDDDAGVSNNLGNYFPWEENGFQVVETFYDGHSAYNYLQHNHVDVILSDIKMANMNGIELARRLSNENRKEIIIFISAYKDFEYAQKAMEYGVSFYFLKPITYNEIKQKIEIIKTMLQERKDKISGIVTNNISDKLIIKIRQYINENIRDADLTSVAECVQMNPSYLSRYFKDKTGDNLFSYITCVRMKQALLLLQDETIRTVQEIGKMVGYNNAISFSKTFIKQYGITPTEYRRNFNRIDYNQIDTNQTGSA